MTRDGESEDLAGMMEELLEAQRAIERTARSTVESVRRTVDHEERLVPRSSTAFLEAHAKFYDGMERELTGLGFRTVGDAEPAGQEASPPDRRAFYRFAVSDDGLVVAQWFVIPAENPVQFLGLTSWFGDDRSCASGRGMSQNHLPMPPGAVQRPLEASLSTWAALEAHRRLLEEMGGRPRVFRTMDAVREVHEAENRAVAEWRKAQGLALFEPMLRSMLGDDYDDEGAPILEAILAHPEWWEPNDERQAHTTAPAHQQRLDGDPVSANHANQLGIPPDVRADPQAYEVARVWSSGDQQIYVLDVAKYDEPAAWGMFAIDLMKHAARAYEQLDGRSKEDTYKRILAGFMAEMQDPTEPL